MDQVWIFLGILVALALIGGLVTYFVGGRSPRGPDGDERTVPPQIEDRTRPTSELPKDRVDEPGLTVPIDAPMTADEALEAISEAREQDDAEGVIAPAKVPSMRDRLSRARSGFGGYLRSIRSRNKIDSDTWDELEEALIRADVGVHHTQSLLEAVRERVKTGSITSTEDFIDEVKSEMKSRLAGDTTLHVGAEKPSVWLFVGVNGVGKTTTIGKIGTRLAREGYTVIMAAGDTFRAAAAEQLGTWAGRSGSELVRGAEGADPSSVIFDAVARGAATSTDVVLADTAGRLHTKNNLMDELKKVRRVAAQGAGSVDEVLLVIDATTGQNGLNQAVQFTEAADVTGVVLTKLDGSAKGGIVYAIREELGLPIKLVGLGETAVDLIEFDPESFVEALFDTGED